MAPESKEEGDAVLKKKISALNVIINLIFYPVVAVVLVVGILLICGVKPYITMSGSMEPQIKTGSVCFVNTKAAYSEIRPGDIIAYETAVGGLVTHRVISVTEEGLETKGDNNEMSDGVSTTFENFRGKTLFSVPYAGYVLKTLQQPTSLMVGLILLVGFLMYQAVDHFGKKEEKDD